MKTFQIRIFLPTKGWWKHPPINATLNANPGREKAYNREGNHEMEQVKRMKRNFQDRHTIKNIEDTH